MLHVPLVAANRNEEERLAARFWNAGCRNLVIVQEALSFGWQQGGQKRRATALAVNGGTVGEADNPIYYNTEEGESVTEG